MGRYKKAIVVGGGPAGAACAIGLGRAAGCEVQVLERTESAVDKVCAGGVSPRALAVLRSLGLAEPLWDVGCPISGARIVARDGTEQIWSGTAKTAVVVRRSVFDSFLLDAAAQAGATLRRGVRVDRLLRSDGHVVGVGAGNEEIEGDVVVLAAGARCGLAWDPRPRRWLDAVICRYEGASADPRRVQLSFEPDVSPNYAWLFPEPGGTVNVGLCCAHDPSRGSIVRLLDRIAAERFPDLKGATPIGRPRGHPIVYSPSARYLVGAGVVCVGEAARLTDGFTGEGIWHALRSGLEAARAIGRGELAQYEARARLVFDPVLLSSRLAARFAATSAFSWSIRAAGTSTVQSLLTRIIAGWGFPS